MNALFRRHRNPEAGSSIVELAIALPVVVLTLFGTIDLARVFYTSIELTNAARAGAQYGAANLAQSANLATMRNTATGAVNITGVTATAATLCQCANNTGAFSPTSGGANNCTAPATTSCPGLHRVLFVTVTAAKTFNLAGGVAGITSIGLLRTATLRVSE
jgi:Flp pilus assembly protein TadG